MTRHSCNTHSTFLHRILHQIVLHRRAVLHNRTFAICTNLNVVIQHTMQSIGASLVTLSFALDCTVQSAGLLASFKVGNSFLFVRHLPSRSCQRWKVVKRTRLMQSSFQGQNSRTGLFLVYVHDKTLKPDYFWLMSMTKL